MFGFSKLEVMFGHELPGGGPLPVSPTSSSPASASCIPPCRSIDPVRAPRRDRPRTHSRRMCSWWRSAPISTPRRRPGWPRLATSSIRCRARSRCGKVLPAFERGPAIIGVTGQVVQVSSRAERGGAPAARLSVGAGAPGRGGDLAGDAVRHAHSAVARTRRRRFSQRSPSAASASSRTPSSRALDPGRNVAVLSDGSEMPYALFLGVPDPPRPAGRRGVGPVVASA